MSHGPASARNRARRNFLARHTACHYCLGGAQDVDHIVPRALGGRNAIWNYVPSCSPCNQARGDTFPTCKCARCCNAIALTVVAPLMPRQFLMQMTDWTYCE